jgi:hypothetical protein
LEGYVFEGLIGEDGGADFAGLIVPDKFALTLVGEEERGGSGISPGAACSA